MALFVAACRDISRQLYQCSGGRVLRSESMHKNNPCLLSGWGMTIEDFQIVRIRHVTESLKSAVILLITLSPKCFKQVAQ